MGADSHGTKTVFLRSPTAITCTGQIGAPSPLNGFSPKVTRPNFGARNALVYEDRRRKLHSSLKGSTPSQNTLGSENLMKGFRELLWGRNFNFNSPLKFWGQGCGIGFGTKLYAPPRVSYGDGERILGNSVAFYGCFHFPLNFTQLWGAVTPPFMTIKDGNTKVS